jgi:hypothetical protein
MSRLKLLSILLLLSLLLPACGRRESVDEAPELMVELEVIPSPPNPGPTLLMIQILDERGGEIEEFTLDVRGDMSHAGMTPVIVERANGRAGTYAVPFEWTMAGDWFVTITATLPDGRSLVRTLPVRVEP